MLPFVARDFGQTPIRAGESFSGHERNCLFLSQGERRFEDMSGVSGLDDPADGRSFAWLDLDRDGWIDLAIVNANAPLLELYRNRIGDLPGPKRGMIALRFVGANRTAKPMRGAAARDGYGARAIVELVDGRKLLRESRCGEGMAAQNSATRLVGIGSGRTVRSITVRWPSGREQRLADVAEGSLVVAYEDAKEAPDGRGFAVSPYRRPATRRPAPAVEPGAPLDVRIPEESAVPRLRVIVTMATWCQACKDWLPHLKALRAAFAPEDVEFYGVPIDPTEDRELLEAYVEENKPAYRLLMDLGASQKLHVKSLLLKRTGGDSTPSTVVTSDRDEVLLVREGLPTVSDLRKLLFRPR